MRRLVQCMAVAALCCAGMGAIQDAGTDPRLVEAQALFDEATKLKAEGRYTDGIPKIERALSLREAALGDTSLEVAACLNLAGDLYREQGDYDRAESLLKRGLSIREAALGHDHLDVAASINNLATLYDDQGKYRQAETLYERVLAIREATLGSQHSEVAAALNNLSVVYSHQYLFDRAESLLERSLIITESTLGKNHPRIANILNNMAIDYVRRGMYERAELLCERALAIAEATLGRDHPDVANMLGALSAIYAEEGLYSRAESLLIRALAIIESAQGKASPQAAMVLNNLSELYGRQKQYGRAQRALERALAIQKAAYPKDHTDIAATLRNLAFSCTYQAMYSRAEALLKQALAIDKAAGNDDGVANNLQGLGILRYEQGRYDEGASFYEQALAIHETVLGSTHPFVANSLNDLAWLRLRQRRLADATKLFEREAAISEGRLRREALDFSEARLAGFLQFLDDNEQHLYSLVRDHPENSDVRRLALSISLLFKGRSVEEAADTSRTILRDLDPQDRDTFERLRGLRTQLAELSLDGPAQLAPAEYQQRLARLTQESDAVEADLAKRSAPLRAQRSLPSVDSILDRVAASLPADGALVELVAYAGRPLFSRPGVPESTLPAHPGYLALVLLPGGLTASVDLGPAAPIDSASSRLRNAFANRDTEFEPAARKLYQLAFKPVLPLLGNAQKVFLAPDSQLALVPFGALHDGHRFLADAFDFTYLTSGRDLLPRSDDIAPHATAVVFADPDFGATLASTSAPDAGVSTASASTERSTVDRFVSGLPGQRWVKLPGTRVEAQAIHDLLPQAQLFLGADSTKEHLFEVVAPGILHIATHGLFRQDADAAAPGTHADQPRQTPGPLLRSALVFAGANAPAAAAGGSPSSHRGDSLATALELAGLNLWGTQLVVLSACDTGRGDVKLGQGVYGLRRAFLVAGAETLVVSLWKVDDDTTRTMMESYYRNLLAGQGRAAALRAAMLSLRAQHPHPHDWAPFIALGRDAPLRGFVPATPPSNPGP